MRILRDIYSMVMSLVPVWKLIRNESKTILKFKTMENEIGKIGTFLHMFEEDMMHLPDEMCKFAIQTFGAAYFALEEDEKDEKDIALESTLKQYASKYEVDFPL